MRTIPALPAKLARLTKTTIIISGAAAIAIMASGAFAIHHVAVQRSIDHKRQVQAAADEQLRQSKLTAAELQKKQSAAAAAQTNPAANPAASNASAKSAATPTKYATSSDPRSTAYSLTPPAPAPGSFNYKVTHAGQFKYGDPLYMNGTKGEKGFYAGDLVISPSTVTISRSGPHQANVTVSGYNGMSIGAATLPWDDQSPYMIIAMDTNLVASRGVGPSIPMFVDMWNVPANGTYTLHIATGPVPAPTPDGWESDGFITVNVVD